MSKVRIFLATVSFENPQQENKKELQYLFKTVPSKYYDAIKYLNSFFYSMADNIKKMRDLLEEHKQRYMLNSNKGFSGHAFCLLWEIQAFAYNYYFFFKGNNLPIDHFLVCKTYLESYVEAMLSTYSPATELINNEEFGFMTHRQHYPLNEYDLDIIVKYSSLKLLEKWLKEYSIQTIETDGDIRICKKYHNLCLWCTVAKGKYWIEQLSCFTKIICLIPLSDDEKILILNSIIEMCEKIFDSFPAYANEIFNIIFEFIKNVEVKNAERQYSELLDIFINTKSTNYLKQRNKSKMISIINQLSQFASDELKNKVLSSVTAIANMKERLQKICLVYPLFPHQKFQSVLEQNINLLDNDDLFCLIVNKIIPLSQQAKQKFLNSLSMSLNYIKNNPSVKLYPDPLKTEINHCIIFILLDLGFDISYLKPFVNFSEYLSFMLAPDSFDYSKVNLNDYMWRNLIYSDKYSKYFVEYKNKLLCDDLKKMFKMGIDSREQQKIVYGLLLSKDELIKFPDD